MPENLKEKLNIIKQNALADLEGAQSLSDLEKLQIKYFGRKQGELNNILRGLSELGSEERKEIGGMANSIKKELVIAFNDTKNKLAGGGQKKEFFDVTAPGIKPPEGHLHPLTHMKNEVRSIFGSMGFEMHEGNELTDLYYNFLSLNFPENHPAMDSYDTFYIKDPSQKKESALKDRLVMRAHTSNMQVKIMENNKPPLRVIVAGRCFRNERTDASHEHTFHQFEGFVIDDNISVANLIATIKNFYSKLFKKDVEVRLRPGYFPFVEPGFELDLKCTNCNGKGCSVCKQVGWLEMLGCGMIHPGVFEAAGYPKGKYTGFAFGGGWDRLAMMKYGINYIKLFMSGDLRFINQF